MRFNRIKLQQVGPHELTDVELGDGLIGVFGPQGSGKSTLFNLAYAALTNDYSRVEGNKDGAVRQQSDRKEPSRIEVWGEHNGTKFQLSRRLAPSSSHSLILNDQPAEKKANEIQRILEGVLGVDRQTLDRYVFVEQWGLRALFQATETERAKTLAHLCNTRHAEACWDIVGKQLDADMRLAAEVDDNTDELRAKLGRHQAELETIEKSIAELTPTLLSDEERQVIKRRQADKHRRDWIEAELPGRREQEASLLSHARECVKAAKDVAQRLTEAATPVTLATAALQTADEAVRDYAVRLKAWESQQELLREQEKQEARLKAEPPAEPAEVGTAAEITQLIEEASERLAPFKALVGSANRLASTALVCPTCGQSIEDLQEKVREARVAAVPIAAEIKRLQAALAARQDYDSALLQFETRQHAYREQLQKLRAQLAAEVFEPNPGDATELKQARQEASQALQTAKQNLDEVTRQSAKIVDAKTAAVTRHKEAKASLEALTNELATLSHVDEAQVVDDNAKLAAHQTARERLAGLSSAKTLQEQMTTETAAEITRIETLLERSRKARGWVAHLQMVRSAFHRDALPRLVHHDALASMEDGINKMLETFDSPFRVTTSADLSYVAHFRNGTVMPAKGLSGGQQVVLAIAFRWVLNSLFAGQIGMMVLDEPTAGLDRRHVDLLETALRALGAEARSRGCQVILVTHELSLEPVFDQVVKLGKSVA